MYWGLETPKDSPQGWDQHRAGSDSLADAVPWRRRRQTVHGDEKTNRAPNTTRYPDLVRRDFTAAAPNQLWVTDLKFVSTRAGLA